jgi:site-specific recombinase XerD
MHILQALQKFQTQLEADGRSSHTRKQYDRHVRLFARWLATRRHSGAIGAVGHEDVAKFLASPQARLRPDGRAKRATSANALRTSVRVFLKYCHESGVVAQNPGRLIRRAHCSPPPPRPLSEDEAERLMASLAEGDSPEAKRDYALFHLMLASGIRLGSAIALDVEDVDLAGGILHLRRMKGDRSDYVFLGRRIRAHLRRFVRNRTMGPLFIGIHGRRLSPRHVQRRYRQWVEKAEITRATSTHCLRHSFATNLYAKTGDVFLVQRALCHRSVASTLVYAQMNRNRLRQALGA